jgi:hypothetical protein
MNLEAFKRPFRYSRRIWRAARAKISSPLRRSGGDRGHRFNLASTKGRGSKENFMLNRCLSSVLLFLSVELSRQEPEPWPSDYWSLCVQLIYTSRHSDHRSETVNVPTNLATSYDRRSPVLRSQGESNGKVKYRAADSASACSTKSTTMST